MDVLGRWGQMVAARRRFVAAVGLLVALVGVVWGAGVFGELVTGGFEDPGSGSAQADAQISRSFGSQNPDVLALYSSSTQTANSPGFRDAVEATARRLRTRPGVASVASAYDGTAGLTSRDGHATYLVIRLTALDDSGKRRQYDAIKSVLTAPGLTTQVGGAVAVGDRIDAQTKSDVSRGEMVAMPLVLVLLTLIFGGVVAASMPLLVGVLSVLGAFTVVRLLTLVTGVSTFAANTITLLGLGMAIDYSLLIINRFREELRDGHDPRDAVVRTVATAGRTVLISGLLVAMSLASLLIFPEVFLRSMAVGGMAAVLVAMLASLSVLPAVLAMLGRRVNAGRIRLPWTRHGHAVQGGGAWARLARNVMRRPVRYIGAVVLVLTVLAAPLLHVRFGSVDERILPPGDPARTVAEQVRADFPAATASPIMVVLHGATNRQAAALTARIGALPDVTSARLADTRGASALITANYTGTFASRRALDAVGEIRGLTPPPGSRLLVGGDSATTRDELQSLSDRLPWMLAVMALVTFAVLLLTFGSLLLPIKAVLTNVVSIAATFGALVWVFQDGHLAAWLGITATGQLEPTVLILVLAILFGLATDYEVFLLSRVREQWDATGDNTTAVASGLQRTGRIITAAAALLILVTGAFATGQIVITKLIGIGTAFGILLDATLIRALLVPATMRLLGRWNWWAPGPIARLHQRFDIDDPSPTDRPPARPVELSGRSR